MFITLLACIPQNSTCLIHHRNQAISSSVQKNCAPRIHSCSTDSLIDRGANGGKAGSDLHIIASTDMHVNISRINKKLQT